ncbi:MAG: site-2 protease family protein [Bacilli bacterium]|nr:site-2 protease family protein [Bacilli bacterium]
MSTFLTILVSILEIIVILGVLISLHEAGHLGMAKAFHVYCYEYSIGFGPKILRKKRKTGETYFCIGAIPFGGYVAMYGEEGSIPEEEVEHIDPSRSLLNKPKWQQAIIMVAGVTVNFILGLILIFVSDIAFPQYYFAYGAGSVGNGKGTVASCVAPVDSLGQKIIDQVDAQIASNPGLKDYKSDEFVFFFPGLWTDEEAMAQLIYVSEGATISTNETMKYIATYYPSSLIDNHDLASSVLFYNSTELKESDAVYSGLHELGFTTRADLNTESGSPYYLVKNAADGVKVTFTVPLVPNGKHEASEEISYIDLYKNKRVDVTIVLEAKSGAWVASSGYEMTIPVISQFNSWNEAWQKWAGDVPTACGAIVKGFISLFQPGGFQNISGIVGMTAALPSLTSSGGAARIFYFAGLLSINLAFFNLLPFPGLDGWQLVTLVYEAIARRKMNPKVKGIISYVGIGLLFVLIIAVTVKDIISLFL